MCQPRSMSRKYRNVRHKRISGAAARPRTDLLRRSLVDLSVSVEMSTLVETSHAQFFSVLKELACFMPSSAMSWAADDPVPLERRIVTIRSSGTCKVVDKGKIERLVGELPRYTKIVVLFKRKATNV